MTWGFGLNWPHVTLWRRLFMAWLVFVAFGLVLGWRFGPRPDEVAFMLVLPLLVVLPYAVGCLGLAVLRLLWASAHRRAFVWRHRRLLAQAHQRIGRRPAR